MTTLNTKPPCRLADIPGGWAEERRAVALRDGHAVSAGEGYTIEVQSINTGKFHALVLPSGGVKFASAEARDAVLDQIIGT